MKNVIFKINNSPDSLKKGFDSKEKVSSKTLTRICKMKHKESKRMKNGAQ